MTLTASTRSRIRIALEIAGGIAILVLAVLLYIRTGQLETSRAQTEAAEQRHLAFANAVKAKAEEISRRFEAYSRRVEADQNRVSQEVSRDYQIRLAELRAHYDRILRERAGGTNPGRPGNPAGVPPVPDPARGPDGSAEPSRLSLAERLLASEQALRLLFLQQWVREQAAVERGPVPVD